MPKTGRLLKLEIQKGQQRTAVVCLFTSAGAASRLLSHATLRLLLVRTELLYSRLPASLWVLVAPCVTLSQLSVIAV